jgi:hypothetical protein
MSLIDHPISQLSLDISPIRTPVITAEVKKTAPSVRRLSLKLFFYVGTTHRIYLYNDDFDSDSTLVLGLIHVEFF